MFAWLQDSARRPAPLPGVRGRVAGLLDAEDFDEDVLNDEARLLLERYRAYVARTPGSTRAGDLRWLSDEVAAGRAPAAALEAALAGETSVRAAVEAALGLASSGSDGGDRVVRLAEGEAPGSAGATGGLLFCGDPRAVPIAVLAMARLEEPALRRLAKVDASRLLMSQVEIWIRLAERWTGEGDARALIAGDALGRIARRHRGGDAVAYESLGKGPVVVAQMTFERFAARTRGRVEAIGLASSELWG